MYTSNMRYPGNHRHEKIVKVVVAVLALAIFMIGLRAANLKQNQLRADSNKAIYANVQLGDSPNPSPTPKTSLRFYNLKTKQPLSGQSIVFLLNPDCVSSPCPASSPIIFNADSQGRVVISHDFLKQRPKLYAAGFKLDAYFAFLNPSNPNLITLYEPLEGTKLTYDLSLEEIPIALMPIE